MKRLLISLFSIATASYSFGQNFTNPNCSSLTPEELRNGYNQGLAYGKECRAAAASYFGIPLSTVPNRVYGGQYETVESGEFNEDGNWVNPTGTGNASFLTISFYSDPTNMIQNWPQISLVRESIQMGPYCPLFNSVRADGFEAGFAGIQ